MNVRWRSKQVYMYPGYGGKILKMQCVCVEGCKGGVGWCEYVFENRILQTEFNSLYLKMVTLHPGRHLRVPESSKRYLLIAISFRKALTNRSE